MIAADSITAKAPLLKDRFGDLIATSAGEPYDNLTRDDGIDSFTITKNFATINLSQLSEFMNSVNLNDFFGHEAGKVKLSRHRWEQLYRGSCEPYYRRTFGFDVREQDWTIEPLDRGTYYLVGNNKFRFVDNLARPMQKGNLDGQGGELAQGSELETTGPWQVYEFKDFADLGLPTDFV